MKSTLAGGVGRGYFLIRSARVRIPPGTKVPVAQWQSVGTLQPLVPRPERFRGAAFDGRAITTTLAGGVGNGYFGGGGCGFESRRERRLCLRGLTAGHPKNSVAACSPAWTFLNGAARQGRTDNHLGRWCRQRILRRFPIRRQRVRFPPGPQGPGCSKGKAPRKRPMPLVPRP